MLPALTPVPGLVRASSRLVRHVHRAKSTQIAYRSASSSSSVPYTSHTIREEVENDETDYDAAPQRRQRPQDTTFSHFFDKRMPAPKGSDKTASSRPKASHDIVAASRDAVAAFRDAISTRDPDQIIDAYDYLLQAQTSHVQDVQDSSSRTVEPADISFPVRKADIQAAIRSLIQHAQNERQVKPRYIDACHQMFQDMSQRFGFRIGPTDLHRQLKSYCMAKTPLYDPCEAFERLRTEYPDWQTTPVDWNMVISYLARRRLYASAIKVWQDMQGYSVQADEQLRKTMLQVLLAADRLAEALLHIQEFAKEEEGLSIDILTTTVEGLCKVVETKGMELELMEELHTRARGLKEALDSHPQAATDASAWQAILHYEAIVNGPAHALQTARTACKPGLLDYSTLCMLLKLHVDKADDLQSSDEALELLDRIQAAVDPKRTLRIDDRCYGILMHGLLNRTEAPGSDEVAPVEDGDTETPHRSSALPSPNQIHEAQALYDHVRSLDVPPTKLLVHPLLTAYCESFLPSLPSAMKLVQDMLDHRTYSRKNKDARTSTIDMTTIRPVLDACVKLRDILCARDLLSRLSEAGIAIPSKDKADIICRLARIAPSWSEAFDIYRTLSHFPTTLPSGSRPSSRCLNDRDHVAVLTTFCSLSFSDAPSAPPEDLLSLLTDLSATSCSVYTLVLNYFSKLTRPSYLGVQMTHELLKRDATLEPDLALINALMNAYNRVNEPAMVLAIWDSLSATRQEVDGTTMSVVFDTAGRHGLLALARKVVGERREVMGKGAWDSWLECLARCGRLEEAVEVACGEMRRGLFRQAIEGGEVEGEVGVLMVRSMQAPVRDRKGRIVGPDGKTLETLLKFAARERDRRKRQVVSLLPGPTSARRAAAGGSSIWHTLRARIREEFSWLYPHVKHIGQEDSL